MDTSAESLRKSIKRLEDKIEAGQGTPGTHLLLKDYKSQLAGRLANKKRSGNGMFPVSNTIAINSLQHRLESNPMDCPRIHASFIEITSGSINLATRFESR